MKSTYVDGFVLTVPKKNIAAYKKMATDASKVWKRFGALSYKECMIDDPKPAHITFTFHKMAKSKPTDTVWFSYIEYKSRQHRDAVNKKVMAYFQKKYTDHDAKSMPFDMKKIAFAGFKVVVQK